MYYIEGEVRANSKFLNYEMGVKTIIRVLVKVPNVINGIEIPDRTIFEAVSKVIYEAGKQAELGLYTIDRESKCYVDYNEGKVIFKSSHYTWKATPPKIERFAEFVESELRLLANDIHNFTKIGKIEFKKEIKIPIGDANGD